MKKIIYVLITLVVSTQFLLGCSDDDSTPLLVAAGDVGTAIDQIDSPGEISKAQVQPRFETALLELQIESQMSDARQKHETFKLTQEIQREPLLNTITKTQESLAQATEDYESQQNAQAEMSEKYEAYSEEYESLKSTKEFVLNDTEISLEGGEDQFKEFFLGLQTYYEDLMNSQITRLENESLVANMPSENSTMMLAQAGFQQLKDELRRLENKFFKFRNTKNRIAELKTQIAQIEAQQNVQTQAIEGVLTTLPEMSQYIEELKALVTNIEMATDQQKALNVFLINNPPQYSLDKLVADQPWEGLGSPFDFELDAPNIFNKDAVHYLSGKHETINMIASAYGEWRKEQESVDVKWDELQVKVQEALTAQELTPAETLEDQMHQLSEHKDSIQAELTEKESTMAQYQTELETLQAQVASIDQAIEASLREYQTFEQQVVSSPNFKKIDLMKTIEKDGLENRFDDVISLLVEQQLVDPSISEDKKKEALIDLDMLVEESLDVDVAQLKLHYENVMKTLFHSEKDLLYNSQAVNLFHPIIVARVQDLSGTLLFNTVKWKADNNLNNIVIIFTPGHMLPGFVTAQEDGTFHLTGVETTTPGFSLKNFGPTTEVAGEVRVFDAQRAITLHVLGQHLGNWPDYLEDMQKQMESVGFKRENLLPIDPSFLVQTVNTDEVLSPFYPLAFGEATREGAGDIPRESFDPVDVNQYTKSDHLAVE